MKVFIVFAHPEPRSLTGSLLNTAVAELKALSHEVQVSDLYAMKWKSQDYPEDFPEEPIGSRFSVARASARATMTNTLPEDVKREQEKLLWADVVILQFPIWWYGMPAILKGWIDRVYSCLFAYGLGEYNDKHWGDRYGEGKLSEKRAMLLLTIGSRVEHYSARGICGPIDDVLFTINHGMLFYTGFEVLPEFTVYNSDRLSDAAFSKTANELRERLRTLSTTKPIAYRPQNGGEYEIPKLTLKPGLEDPGAQGFSIHSHKS